jgi:hypothetical protein
VGGNISRLKILTLYEKNNVSPVVLKLNAKP